jgi:hypothetical protein
VLPSNSETLGALAETGIAVDVPNGYVFDTDLDCIAGSVLGDCTPVSPVGSPRVCVCQADSVVVHDLEVRGTRALAVLAWSSVTVQGNWSITPGAGGVAADAMTPATAGGSYSTVGGGGGRPAYGTPELVPLVGGMGGGGVNGGVGGGALQITAGDTVRVDGTVNVPGGGASSNCDTNNMLTGSGGASGGGLLIEARHVEIVGGIAANGGGGGGGAIRRQSNGDVRCGGSGENGIVSRTVYARGGSGATVSCSGHTYAHGGYGGEGSLLETVGGDFTQGDPGSYSTCSYWDAWSGGGGGGAGRIRINTDSTPCGCSGELSPMATFGTVVVQ